MRLRSIKKWVLKHLLSFRLVSALYEKLILKKLQDIGACERVLGNIDENWRERIECVKASRFNKLIPRTPEAGKLLNGCIEMHNGIKIYALSYYGAGMMNLLIENQGVHEPEEEYIFAQVLKRIPDGGTMLELGAYWAYYSAWFASEVTDARCFLVEPEWRNLIAGKLNFSLNEQYGLFVQAFVGSRNGKDGYGNKIIAVDAFLEEHGIEKLSILHADIQKAELKMLHGTRRSLANKKIDYLFLSTHSKSLHYGCLEFLQQSRYSIKCSTKPEDSSSYDGLLVAVNPEISVPAWDL